MVHDWEIHHIDIKSAYLNVPLKEKVYMKLPPGVLNPREEGKVCQLLNKLHQHQKISDLGELTWYLGFRMCQD